MYWLMATILWIFVTISGQKSIGQQYTNGFKFTLIEGHSAKMLCKDFDIKRSVMADSNKKSPREILDLVLRSWIQVRQAAYVGSLGLFLMVAGSLLSLRYRNEGNPTNASNSIRNLSIIGGGGIMIGSFLSALSFIKTNETHLGTAVNYFNQAHPDTPIELQFNTGINF